MSSIAVKTEPQQSPNRRVWLVHRISLYSVRRKRWVPIYTGQAEIGLLLLYDWKATFSDGPTSFHFRWLAEGGTEENFDSDLLEETGLVDPDLVAELRNEGRQAGHSFSKVKFAMTNVSQLVIRRMDGGIPKWTIDIAAAKSVLPVASKA